MKKYIFYTLLIAVFLLNFNNVFAYETAKEAFSDVFASVMDDKREVPVFLKSVEKEFKNTNLQSKKYIDTKNEIREYINTLPEKTISTKKEASNIVLEINKKIKLLNKIKSDYEKSFKIFSLKSKNISTGNPSIDKEFQIIFNDLLSYELENFSRNEHQNILEQMYKTRDFYTYLSKTSSQFYFLNGYPVFQSKALDYEYYKYLANLRNLSKNYLILENKKIEYLKNSKLSSFFDKSFMDNLDIVLVSNNNLITIWNSPATQTDWNLSWIEGQSNSNIKSDLNKSELELRRFNNVSLQKVNSEIQENLEDYQKFGVYDKERFKSKDNLKKAITLSQKMLNLFKSTDLIDYSIRIQYEKDFPSSGNIFKDLMLSSDEDFNNFFVFIQKNSLNNEDIEIDLKIYNLALNNFSKLSVDFDSEKVEYRLKFKNKNINSSYKKIIDNYRTKYAELFEYIEKYNEKNNQLDQKI